MKKTIYLQDENGNFQKYEHENISDLNKEFKKRNIKIGAMARIGAGATIGAWATIEEGATIGAGAKIGARAKIGAWATIEEGATIGARATIGAWATIEEGATIGDSVSIGDNARIGDMAKIGDNASIGKYNSFFAVNIYDYPCGAWIENRGEIIQLGCFTRTRKEWEADFWNNDDEFPNDNSEKSKARLRAFKMCCNFLDLIKK